MTDNSEIIYLHYQGVSIVEIFNYFKKKYRQKDIAGIIAKSDMTIDRELFIVIPSKMNYDFRLVPNGFVNIR